MYLLMVSSGCSGSSLLNLSKYSFVNTMGLTSVSGYIRAAPGLGRIYRVVPSGFAARVSSGTPSKASLALPTTARRASIAFSRISATNTTASWASAPTTFLSLSTSSADIPYPGISSVWKMPPTLPQNRAMSASSDPSLMPGASSIPSSPANLGSRTAITTPPLFRAFRITLHFVFLKTSDTSTNFSWMSSFLTPRLLSSSRILRRLSWR